jgi:hypothetical protein
VNSRQRRIEFLRHLIERDRQRSPPADEHVIVAGAQLGGRRHAHHLTQPPAHPITLNRIADLARHCKADTDAALVTSRTRVQHESAAGGSLAARCGPKIAAALQPFDNDGAGPITH